MLTKRQLFFIDIRIFFSGLKESINKNKKLKLCIVTGIFLLMAYGSLIAICNIENIDVNHIKFIALCGHKIKVPIISIYWNLMIPLIWPFLFYSLKEVEDTEITPNTIKAIFIILFMSQSVNGNIVDIKFFIFPCFFIGLFGGISFDKGSTIKTIMLLFLLFVVSMKLPTILILSVAMTISLFLGFMIFELLDKVCTSITEWVSA